MRSRRPGCALRLALASLCCAAALPASGQGAPDAEAKPQRVFDIPATLIGPGLESVKRQVTPSAPAAAESESAAQPIGAPPAEAGARSLQELKRLSKQEILASVSPALAAYILKGNERTVVLDFPTTHAQGLMFGRVILFIERDGTSRTRVMPAAEVAQWLARTSQRLETLTVGNNIRTGELARFFNTAKTQGEPLTVAEQWLYNWLLQLRLLREDRAGVSAAQPESILISVPQVSADEGCAACSISTAQREVVLEHELSHAAFATDPPYRQYAMRFWSQGLNPAARAKFTRFLRSRGYDAGNPELLANEMQAFLMHTPDAAMFGAAAVGMTEKQLLELRRRFRAGLPAGVRDQNLVRIPGKIER